MAKKLTKAQLARISELVDLFEEEGLTELAVEEDGLYVELKSPQALQLSASGGTVVSLALPASADGAGLPQATFGEAVPAPMTGVFYRAPAPDEPPYVDVGDGITVGQTIGLIEAMKVFSEVPAPLSGRIVEIVADNGKLVGEGDVLMVLDPRG